jgi:hypothetical protein
MGTALLPPGLSGPASALVAPGTLTVTGTSGTYVIDYIVIG